MQCPVCNKYELRPYAWIPDGAGEYKSEDHYDCANCGPLPYDVVHAFKATVDGLEARLRAVEWQTQPPPLDATVEIAVELSMGWFRCIGSVGEDFGILDWNGDDVGYEYGIGCYWRELVDPPQQEEK